MLMYVFSRIPQSFLLYMQNQVKTIGQSNRWRIYTYKLECHWKLYEHFITSTLPNQSAHSCYNSPLSVGSAYRKAWHQYRARPACNSLLSGQTLYCWLLCLTLLSWYSSKYQWNLPNSSKDSLLQKFRVDWLRQTRHCTVIQCAFILDHPYIYSRLFDIIVRWVCFV